MLCFFTDSTCSRDSCSICETNSSADDESEKSWIETNEKPANNTTKKFVKIAQPPVTASRPHRYRKNAKPAASALSSSSNTNRINIPKPELKVSHYSKNSRNTVSNTCKTIIDSNKTQQATPSPSPVKKLVIQRPIISRTTSEVDFGEMQTTSYQNSKPKLLPTSSFSTDYVNHMVESSDPLKYQQNKIEKIPRPLPRIPYATPQILQSISQHRVVDICPKPMNARQTAAAADWDVPDQTIGIPLTNAMPIVNFCDSKSPNDNLNYTRQSFLLPSSHMQSMQSSSIHHPKPPPMLMKSKSLHNIPINMPHIIHHPLISGRIPPTFHSNDNYLVKKQIPLDAPPPLPQKPSYAPANTSILSTQQNSQAKKENGEKNKVKFSDTVTVAMVPVKLSKYLSFDLVSN